MKTFFHLPPLIFLCFVLCSWSSWSSWAESAQDVEKVSLQLKWLHSFQFAGYYAAKEQGFYAQENLDVEIRESVAGISTVEQVLNGEAQYGVADTALLQERLSGKPVVVLASIFQHNPLVLVTLKKSGIVSPYELPGKRVMNNPGNDAPLLAMYYETGVDSNKIVQVENTFDLNDLITGKVDAFSAYLTDQIDELTRQGVEFNIIDPRNYGVDFLGDNLFTTEQEITQHSERTQRFLRASLKGWDYALKHPEEIIQLILKKYNAKQRLSEAHLRFEATETAKMILPDSIPLGSTDVKRFQRIADTYQRLGLVSSIERLQGFIYGQAQQNHQDDFSLAERAWLRAHPVLRVGVHTDFAPFEWLDDKGNYVGLSADYIALVADYLGVKIEVVTGKDWSEVLNQAKNGEIELLANVTPTPERQQYLNFSEPYSNYPIVIIDNGKGAYVRDLQQLSGKQVVIVVGYFLEELLKHDHPELQQVRAKNVQDALKRLNNGEADAYVGDAVSANYVIKTEGLLNLRFTGETEYRIKSSMATGKNNPELLSLLNKALASVPAVEQNRIQSRWLSLQAEQQLIDLKNLVKYGAIVLLIIIVIIYWNLRLRRAVQKSNQLEIKLRQNEAKLHAIINACPIPLALNDESQHITFVNPEFIKCFGYNKEDIPTLADWWVKAYPDPDYRTWVAEIWAMAMDKAKREHADFEAVERNVCCKNGSIRTVMASATPLGDEFEKTQLVIFYDITTRKMAESELQKSLTLLQSVINNIPVRVFWKDLDSRYLGANNTFANDAGFTSVEQLIGKDDYAMNHRNKADIYRADDREVITTGVAKLNFEYSQRLPDNSEQWRRTSKVPLCNEAGLVMGVLGIYEDITESKHATEKLALAASVFANTQEGIIITDVLGNIIDANQSFTNITGYTHDEILGKNPKILQSGYHDNEFYDELWQTLKRQRYWQGEVWNRRKNGEIYAGWLNISVVTNAKNEIIHYIGSFSDISLLKQREQQLEQITHYDPLTGLPNRILLADRMNLALAQSKRNACLMAVCYLDVDNFQAVNDQFGYAASDQLLIETTQRIKNTLREEDTLARTSGDEFVFLLQDLARVEDCEQTLHRLLQAIAIPFILQSQTITITASIGISIFPEDDSSPDTLLRHASQAMYQAKQEGKNTFHIYNMELDRQMHAHRIALNCIEQAFENNEFELYFQPKVDMNKGVAFGAEALIRWLHPERGVVMPNAFLPMIENNNELSSRLDEWVINRALQHIEQWQSQGLALKISINVSARSLQSADFVSKLNNAFKRYPLVNRHDFEMEILETEVLNDLEKTAQTIKSCQALGVQFALDDFGTGYSSLSYLRHLPIQTLKIDQSFVRDMLEDDNDLAIVRSIIGLAASFKRQVIAEGVESLEHGIVLMALGCYQSQGYAIAKPMPAADFEYWLDHWKMPIEWQQATTDFEQ
jgi:diguanylate cyclase (GGDEF)-like protein/PAS domain S-box-containing protein